MDDLERMEKALGNAAAAGDVDAASHIAKEMRAMLKAVNPMVDAPIDHADEGAKALAKSTGAGEAALVATGRKMKRIGVGIGDLVSSPSKETQNARSDEDASYSRLQQSKPFATAGGEALPYFAIPPSFSIPAAATTVGIAEAAQPGTAKERLGRGVLGGGTTLAAGIAARSLSNVVAPVTARGSSQTTQDALASLEKLGGRPTLGEATGSPLIRRVEDYVSRVPGGSGVMDDFAGANAKAMNRGAARAMGESADELTPAVFAAARDRTGGVFNEIRNLSGRPIQIGQNVTAAADDILRQQSKMLPTQQDPALIDIATKAKALAQNKGRIDGETYQLTRSGLSEASYDASGTNRVLYGRLLEALDSSADASLRAAGKQELADALKTVRPEYSAIKMLERGAVSEGGNVSPARLASVLRTQNPGAFRRGEVPGPLGDIAKVGEGLKPLKAGSPTFEREAVSNPLSAALNAAWSYPLAKATTSPIVTMYPRAVGRMGNAEGAVRQLEPATRAALIAALQQSNLLPASQ